jgi:hypothetical protein
MTAQEWLEAHLFAAPADLLTTMSAAVAPFEDLPAAEALAKGASALYAQVLMGDGGRRDALPLLAADALLTHAFEAQAMTDPEQLSALAVTWTATELVKQ